MQIGDVIITEVVVSCLENEEGHKVRVTKTKNPVKANGK